MTRRALLLFVLVAACSGGGGSPGTTGAGDGSTTTSPTGSDTFEVPVVAPPSDPTGVAGLYLPAEVAVTSQSDAGFELVAGLPCDDVFEILEASEWTLVSRVAPEPDVAFAMSFAYGFSQSAEFVWGDERLFVRGVATDLMVVDPEGEVPESDFCILQLVRLTSAPVAITGPAAAPTGDAVVYPVRCMEAGGLTFVTMGYRYPEQFVQITFELPAEAVGTYDVPSASLELMIMPIDAPPWELLESLTEGGDDQEGIYLEATEEVAGTVTVESPGSGTVALDRLTAYPGGTPTTLTAPWSCLQG